MRVQVNGEPVELPAGASIASLLRQLERDPRVVAVEHNGSIVRRGSFSEIGLADGDQLEIVQFVQGG